MQATLCVGAWREQYAQAVRADKGQDMGNPLGFDTKLEGLQLAGTLLRVM